MALVFSARDVEDHGSVFVDFAPRPSFRDVIGWMRSGFATPSQFADEDAKGRNCQFLQLLQLLMPSRISQIVGGSRIMTLRKQLLSTSLSYLLVISAVDPFVRNPGFARGCNFRRIDWCGGINPVGVAGRLESHKRRI